MPCFSLYLRKAAFIEEEMTLLQCVVFAILERGLKAARLVVERASQ